METEDYMLRVRASQIIEDAMKNFSTPGEQYLAAYVYLMHRSIQLLDEKMKTEEFANKKLIKVLNENAKLLKELKTQFSEILQRQENLETYMKMVLRKEAVADDKKLVN